MLSAKNSDNESIAAGRKLLRVWRKQCCRERGSITIEAIISLSFFIFMIISLLSVINVCLIQARMAVAINSTAREISEYSYLFSLLRPGEKRSGNSENITGEVGSVFKVIQSIAGGSSLEINAGEIGKAWDDIIKDGEIEVSGGTIDEAAENIASNPVKMLFGFARLAMKGKLDLDTSSRVAAPIVTAMIKKHLTDEKGGRPEDFLRSMNVLPRAGSYMNGLNFRSSLLFPQGSDYIIVNVRYKVKMIPLLPLNINFDFNQTAVTRGWMQGDKR